MKIVATFIRFASDPDVIELTHAWDEWAIDANPTGYEDTKGEALASYEGDILAKATVTIEVPYGAIMGALDPRVTVEGAVSVP